MIGAHPRHQAMALEEIYREHFGFVWAVLRRLGVAERDLEDVVQDVFVVVHRRLAEFEGRAAMRTWLYAITVRVAWNHKRRRRHREPDAETSATGLVAPSASSDPEEHTVRTQAGRLLDELLGRLDDDKRAVFVLSDIEGLTAPQIAAIVGTNPRTVYSRLRAARDRVHGDLARLQAREQSAGERRSWLRRTARDERPPAPAQGRVWAALLVKLPGLVGASAAATGTTAGALGWLGLAQATTLSVALGAAGLGTLWIAASPLRNAEPQHPAEPTVTAERAADRDAARAVEAVAAAAPARPPVASAHEPNGPAASATTPATAPPAEGATARPPTSKRPPGALSGGSDGENDGDLDAVARELPLLEQARLSLAEHDAATALRALDDHARRFPDSVFATDRERSRARALCSLGRREQAEEAARSAGIGLRCDAATDSG